MVTPRPEVCVAVVVVAAAVVAVVLYTHLKNSTRPGAVGLASPANNSGRCKNMTSPAKRLTRRISIPMVVVDGPRGHLHVDLHFTGMPALFFVDTGYAGPLVFNQWHHQRELRCMSTVSGNSAEWHRLSTAERLSVCLADDVHSAPVRGQTNEHIDDFMAANNCTPYATGCKVRLAGIASDAVQSMDMITCPISTDNHQLKLSDDDRLVTMDIPGVCHILTIDYMLSYGGAAITFVPPMLTLGPFDNSDWTRLEAKRVHGAFAVKINIAGREGWFTVDTGSSIPIVLGKTFSQGLPIERANIEKPFIAQKGVNSEKTCASIYEHTTVNLCQADGRFLGVETPLVSNDSNTSGVAGYLGLELIRKVGGLALTSDALYVPKQQSAEAVAIATSFLQSVAIGACTSR